MSTSQPPSFDELAANLCGDDFLARTTAKGHIRDLFTAEALLDPAKEPKLLSMAVAGCGAVDASVRNFCANVVRDVVLSSSAAAGRILTSDEWFDLVKKLAVDETAEDLGVSLDGLSILTCAWAMVVQDSTSLHESPVKSRDPARRIREFVESSSVTQLLRFLDACSRSKTSISPNEQMSQLCLGTTIVLGEGEEQGTGFLHRFHALFCAAMEDREHDPLTIINFVEASGILAQAITVTRAVPLSLIPALKRVAAEGEDQDSLLFPFVLKFVAAATLQHSTNAQILVDQGFVASIASRAPKAVRDSRHQWLGCVAAIATTLVGCEALLRDVDTVKGVSDYLVHHGMEPEKVLTLHLYGSIAHSIRDSTKSSSASLSSSSTTTPTSAAVTLLSTLVPAELFRSTIFPSRGTTDDVSKAVWYMIHGIILAAGGHSSPEAKQKTAEGQTSHSDPNISALTAVEQECARTLLEPIVGLVAGQLRVGEETPRAMVRKDLVGIARALQWCRPNLSERAVPSVMWDNIEAFVRH